MGRRARRREHEALPPARRPPASRPQPASAPPARASSRSEAKDAAARAALEPLREGERPRAVTVAASAAAVLGVANVVVFLAGTKIGHRRPAAPGVVSYSVLMGIAAWGLWRSKYWAVLGMEALLGILILIFGALLVTASNVVAVVVSVAVIAGAGALFWFLIKAMARIQMPERRPQ